jgi:hypothetical protein
MEEQASNNNLHNNDSPLQALTEFVNSFAAIAPKMEWVQPARTGPIPIDFNLIEQSATILVTYESHRTLRDTIDCREDPNDLDPHTIDLYDLEEVDREFEGSGDWISNAYVTSKNYNDLWKNYRTLWEQATRIKTAFYKMANEWNIVDDIIQEYLSNVEETVEGGEA